MFSQGTFGGTAPLLDGDSLELTSGSAIPQDHPGHVHANWAFTAPGTYTMTVKAVAPDGRETNTATYRWVVGNAEEAEEETATATTASAAPAAPVPTSTSAPAEQRALADTGISVMGLAIAFLGLGLIVFGAGIVAARRA